MQRTTQQISEILDAQPFAHTHNQGTRIWQLFADHVNAGDALRAILTIADGQCPSVTGDGYKRKPTTDRQTKP